MTYTDEIIAEETQRIDNSGITKWEEYKKISRAGSKIPLSRKDRMEIWNIIMTKRYCGSKAGRMEYVRRAGITWSPSVGIWIG